MKVKTYRYYIYYLLRVGAFLVGLLPVRMASSLGGFCGKIAFRLLKAPRKRTLLHLKRAFGEKTDRELVSIASNVFSNAASNFAELVHIHKLNKGNIDSLVRAHGMDRIDKALSHGKGAIVLTAHFGNWELVGAYMRMKGYPGATIVRKLYFHKYDEYLRNIRIIHDVGTIDRDDSPKKMLRMLKDNKILGMLADQDIDRIEGVFVDFFGRPAHTPTAPAKMSMASGAPMVPCYMLRNGNKYDFFVDEPIYVKRSNNKQKDLEFYTQEWTRVLESYIMKYPDQWVWMHKRWKTRPEPCKEKVSI